MIIFIFDLRICLGSLIAQSFPERSGKQCRERWFNHLNPGIKKGDWTAEEDRIILTMQRALGNQWAKITKMLPGRTDNAVKNRFHATIRARTRKTGSEGGAYESDVDLSTERDSEAEDDDYDDRDSFSKEAAKISSPGYGDIGLENCIEHDNVSSDMEIAYSPGADSVASIDSIDMSGMEIERETPLDIDLGGIQEWMDGNAMECDVDMEEDGDDRAQINTSPQNNSCFSKQTNSSSCFAFGRVSTNNSSSCFSSPPFASNHQNSNNSNPNQNNTSGNSQSGGFSAFSFSSSYASRFFKKKTTNVASSSFNSSTPQSLYPSSAHVNQEQGRFRGLSSSMSSYYGNH